MPSPWSSCQCQSEQGALVTLSPTPCHLHRKNTHLDDNKIQADKDNLTPSFRQCDALCKHSLKPSNLTDCMQIDVILFSFVNGPAPSGVMVPSLTASGYLVSWKWRRAWLLPPEPSKYLRPHSTFPSVRFIHIFSWRSHTSHLQPLRCKETKVLMKECYISWPKMGEKYQLHFSKMYTLPAAARWFILCQKNKKLKSVVLHIIFQQSHTWQP